MVELLLANKASAVARDITSGSTPLHIAARRASVEDVETLLPYYINNIDVRDDYNTTPLMEIITTKDQPRAEKQQAVVKLLVQHKADVKLGIYD